MDWLWMGTGKDGKDVPIHYNSWAPDEPKKKGRVMLSKRRFLQYGSLCLNTNSCEYKVFHANPDQNGAFS